MTSVKQIERKSKIKMIGIILIGIIVLPLFVISQNELNQIPFPEVFMIAFILCFIAIFLIIPTELSVLISFWLMKKDSILREELNHIFLYSHNRIILTEHYIITFNLRNRKYRYSDIESIYEKIGFYYYRYHKIFRNYLVIVLNNEKKKYVELSSTEISFNKPVTFQQVTKIIKEKAPHILIEETENS